MIAITLALVPLVLFGGLVLLIVAGFYAILKALGLR